MRIFIAKSQKTGLKLTFKYDFKEVLRAVEFDGDWDAVTVGKILPKIPVSTSQIMADIKNQKQDSNWIFAETTDVSFNAFYIRYPKKVGRKEQTQKMWNKLSENDQMEAFLYISELIRLKHDGTAFPYPATYLNQKMWR